MSIIPWLIYSPNIIPIKVAISFFISELDKWTLNVTQKSKNANMGRQILKMKKYKKDTTPSL